MISFIKTLLKKRDRRIKILVLDDQEPEADDSYSLIPNSLIFGLVAGIMFIITIVSLLYIFTPLGMFLYNAEDAELRNEVINMANRLESIQDSLERREDQYNEILNVLRLGTDTTFVNDYSILNAASVNDDGMIISNNAFDKVYRLSQSDIIYSEVLKTAPSFPAAFPAKGTLTRGFNPNEDHFGIDIAAASDKEFIAIANGTVLSSGWSINHGYSIYIQHNNGMLSVYKHASKLFKNVGEIVRKGDFLGEIGSTGLLSSGPHLHFELWKDGIALDPADYLIQ